MERVSKSCVLQNLEEDWSDLKIQKRLYTETQAG